MIESVGGRGRHGNAHDAAGHAIEGSKIAAARRRRRRATRRKQNAGCDGEKWAMNARHVDSWPGYEEPACAHRLPQEEEFANHVSDLSDETGLTQVFPSKQEPNCPLPGVNFRPQVLERG